MVTLDQKYDRLLKENEDLRAELNEYKDIVDAIRSGSVDALAINKDGKHDIFTLESSDIVYRILVENFGEGALNITETGLIVYSNTSFETLVGASSSLIGVEFDSLIDHDSKKKFKQLFKAAFSGKSRGEIILLYKDKKVPVYISLSSLYPRFPGIGIIVTDLSEKKQNEALISDYKQRLTDKEAELLLQIINSNKLLEQANKELAHKNEELTQTNKELASFSYIASHDLQEPLRKIQTFVGKLVESELSHLSVTGEDYFKRIMSASVRMQHLINALFNYSRLNSKEYTYTSVSLDNIIEEVKSNLSDIIEEKNVTINSEGLPSLQILTTQFVQLFANLIDNSIKYSSADRLPEINITSEFLKDLKLNERAPSGNYWKITYTDNGIGFDSEYNEKIFELFSRLHGKSEYSGTGIGLAICKKVVENHNGVIKANGSPGKGAFFQIFVPETQPHIDGA